VVPVSSLAGVSGFAGRLREACFLLRDLRTPCSAPTCLLSEVTTGRSAGSCRSGSVTPTWGRSWAARRLPTRRWRCPWAKEAGLILVDRGAGVPSGYPGRSDPLTLRRMAADALTGQAEGRRGPPAMPMRFEFSAVSRDGRFLCHRNSTHRSQALRAGLSRPSCLASAPSGHISD
jgi:hypothetical protein